MDTHARGELVSVNGDGPVLDGIVFDTPSRLKVVVAVVDRSRGPVFRTVRPETLSKREQEGPDDAALRSLIRRRPAPTRGAAHGGSSIGKGAAGFTRGANHRSTGR